MRITLVCPYDPQPAAVSAGKAEVGGVERVFAEVSRRFAQRGHEVTLLCSTTGPTGRRVEAGVRVVREHRRLTIFRAPVCRLDRRIPPDSDIVHVAATYPFTTPNVLRRAVDLGIPAVLDFHFEPNPPGTLGRWGAAAYRLMGPPIYRLADVVLVRSESYAASSPSLARILRDRLRVVPNGIDPSHFHANDDLIQTLQATQTPQTAGPPASQVPDISASAAQLGTALIGAAAVERVAPAPAMTASGSGDYLLFVGRLVPYKGLDVLLTALSKAKLGIPLIVAGEGPERERLTSQAKRLGVAAAFLGRVADDELPRLYRRAKLTVLPSVNRQEAFGISLIESMACGTPVVASALPGVADVARLGGLVATPGDADDLARTLRAALEPGAVPRGLSLSKAIHDQYSWDAVADRLLSIYGTLQGRTLATPGVTPLAHPSRGAIL